LHSIATAREMAIWRAIRESPLLGKWQFIESKTRATVG